MFPHSLAQCMEAQKMTEYFDIVFDRPPGPEGAPECHAITAYTETRVIQVYQYDGSTGVYSIPRNPTGGEVPEMVGG